VADHARARVKMPLPVAFTGVPTVGILSLDRTFDANASRFIRERASS
jgi:hypothetical protein